MRLAAVTAPFINRVEPVTDVRIGELQDDSNSSAYIEVLALQPNHCYSFVAVAEDPASDLDLHLYAEGIEVASHTAVDSTPVIHWCNAAFDQVSLEVRMYSGSGRYAAQVFARPDDAELSTDPLWGPLNALSARFAEGYVPAAAPMRGALHAGAEDRYDLTLAGGRCYVVVAAGVPTVTDIDLMLYDPANSLLDADLAESAQPVLRYCTESETGARVVLAVRMSRGYGEYGFRVFGEVVGEVAVEPAQ